MKIGFKKKILIFIHTILLLFISLLMVIYPTYISNFIDNISNNEILKKISSVVIFLLLSKNIIKLFDNLLQNYLENSITRNMKDKLAKRIIYSNYLDIIAIDEGKLINLNNDIESITDFYINFVSVIFKNAIIIIGIFFISIKTISYMSLLFVIMILLMLFLFKRIKINSATKVKNTKESYDRMIDLFGETFNLLEEFHFIGKKDFLVNRLRKSIEIFFDNDVVSNFISYEYWLSSLFVFGFMKILVLIFGFFTIPMNIISIGSLYLFIYYIDLIEDPIMDVRLQLETLPNLEEAKNRIVEVMSLSKSDLSYGEKTLDSKVEKIELLNIDFSYGDKVIFEDFSFDLYKKIYALSSPSGSGKSTLINLIARLFDVEKGAIKYNGIDIRQLKKGEISKKIEYIDQKIEANEGELITDILPKGEKTKELLEKFAINKDYDFNVADLSNGEYRTLYLIKALISEKDILILDEIFLGIDDYKCSLFFDLVKDMDKIILIISHEKRIIARADEVINIERS